MAFIGVMPELIFLPLPEKVAVDRRARYRQASIKCANTENILANCMRRWITDDKDCFGYHDGAPQRVGSGDDFWPAGRWYQWVDGSLAYPSGQDQICAGAA